MRSLKFYFFNIAVDAVPVKIKNRIFLSASLKNIQKLKLNAEPHEL